jgi:hypothetical protein
MKNKNQGHYLRDWRIHPKDKSTGEVQFDGLKIPELFAGGNSVVIHTLIFALHLHMYFPNKCIRQNKIKIGIMALIKFKPHINNFYRA